MPKEFSTVRATITYSWCDSSSDTVQLRSDFEKALTTICRNINLLTKKGYTAREIAKFGFLGEAAIKPEELPTGRQGLPRLIGKMHGQEFDDNKLEGFWVHFENIDPGSALAKEIARLATKLLCQLFREQRTVEINDDDGYALVYGENSTHFAVTGKYEPKIAKEPKAIYDVLFACIAQEIRRRQFLGLTHDDIATDSTLEERVEELVLARLGVMIPEKANERIVELDPLT